MSEAANEIEKIMDLVCIAILTTSGRSARFVAAERPKTPLFALTKNLNVYHGLNLLWGINPLLVDGKKNTFEELIQLTEDTILKNKIARSGDKVMIDPNAMQFDVSVDELDVAKLAVGQKVNITLDAITSTKTTPMEGEITKIAVVGTSTSGVTTYPVTIQFTGDVKVLKGGMNANGEIIVDEMKNVLYVPLEAVTTSGTKSYVWVKGSGKTSEKTSSTSNSSSKNKTSSYYENAVKKEVTVGDNTDTYIVIKSGLSAGDTVILPQIKTSSSTSTSSKTSSGGGMGSGSGMGAARGGGM